MAEGGRVELPRAFTSSDFESGAVATSAWPSMTLKKINRKGFAASTSQLLGS